MAQTAIIPTAQLCQAPKIGSYKVTGNSGTLSIVTFTCIDIPAGGPKILCEPTYGVFSESLEGPKDGQNKTFSISATPLALSQQVFLNGQLQIPGIHYNVNPLGSNILVFLVPPPTGAILWVFYRA